jgi:hypothetical protein
MAEITCSATSLLNVKTGEENQFVHAICNEVASAMNHRFAQTFPGMSMWKKFMFTLGTGVITSHVNSNITQEEIEIMPVTISKGISDS